ncbi:SDR family oxidoreductase [Actinomadura barringtoniae]|uniref:SDR family oxidoreductase n=1 Tax=Actinomadura barringtoniae TaxID=1427535 RepID=A0A939PR56_9ACTN|nr:SDR family oxidoreductase [Actinomadura barringtoniae]
MADHLESLCQMNITVHIRGLADSRRAPGHGLYGLCGMSKAAAVEIGPAGIRVNVVSPGATLTPRMVADPRFIDAIRANSARTSLGRLAPTIRPSDGADRLRLQGVGTSPGSGSDDHLCSEGSSRVWSADSGAHASVSRSSASKSAVRPVLLSNDLLLSTDPQAGRRHGGPADTAGRVPSRESACSSTSGAIQACRSWRTAHRSAPIAGRLAWVIVSTRTTAIIRSWSRSVVGMKSCQTLAESRTGVPEMDTLSGTVRRAASVESLTCSMAGTSCP